jgi:hypothetical protein
MIENVKSEIRLACRKEEMETSWAYGSVFLITIIIIT